VKVLDHISLAVADYERSWAFYDQVLATLGHRRVMEMTDAPEYVAAGYGGSEHEPAFWVGGAREPGGPAPQPPDGQHVAFAAASRAMVDAFYEAALRAGATDNGPPGIRAHYHANYYACFVIDPDGYHLEAVCHRPE
jgi:catechol 2,3-dioxygenase-like lactoylglutathione lyase family enzyme